MLENNQGQKLKANVGLCNSKEESLNIWVDMTNQRKKPPYTHAGGGGKD